MWNGFYDMSSIRDNKTLKRFYRDAIGLACHVSIHHIPSGEISREIDYSMTINDFFKDCVDINNHNVCIDRTIYNGNIQNHHEFGEIGCRTMSDKDKFLFIYLNIENLNKLINKYKLENLT